MSRAYGLNAVHCRPNPRIAHTEYSVASYHHGVLDAVLGDKRTHTRLDVKLFSDAWDYDFQFGTNDGPVPWQQRGRTSDMGHADYAEGGADRRETSSCPFEDPEEVLAFDAVKEYGLPDFAELVAYYERTYQENQAFFDRQLCTGGYYKSIISGAIAAFGWDMLLMAAADQDRFAKVLRRIADLTLHHVKAWAETSIEVFIQHDDFVWTEGPFLHPDFYRGVIIPMYGEFWEVLHQAGKKVLFCSDGKFDMFMPDLAAVGAEGFIFEPMNDFAWVVEHFGATHCLVGSAVDCRTMTFDGWEAVKKEMDRTFSLADRCAGLIWACGNHMPANIPTDICLKYMDYLRANWTR